MNILYTIKHHIQFLLSSEDDYEKYVDDQITRLRRERDDVQAELDNASDQNILGVLRDACGFADFKLSIIFYVAQILIFLSNYLYLGAALWSSAAIPVICLSLGIYLKISYQ